jgi:two-component system, LytTR family, response regulator
MKCLIVDDEPLALDVLETHLRDHADLEQVGRCTNAIQAAEVLRNQSVDLIFIDIQMPEITGIDFIKSLENPPLIVFTTAYAEYALDGFELNAIDYLLKPISKERFGRAVAKAKEYYQLKNGNEIDKSDLEEDYIFVKANQKLIKVSYDEIKYVEAFADYVKIYIPERRIVTLQTMKNMEKKLPVDKFCRIHRSFIVGLKHISSYNTSEVEVEGNKLPIGKNFKEQFMGLMKANNVL